MEECNCLTVAELERFIAYGLNTWPATPSYWYTTPSQYCPMFYNMFSRDHFQLILRFFHTVNNSNLPAPGEPGYDPCAKFQPLVNHVSRVFRHHYTPHQQLSVDESLVGTKSHTQLMKYLPNNHHHCWGINCGCCVIQLQITMWHFLSARDQNVLKIRMPSRNMA